MGSPPHIPVQPSLTTQQPLDLLTISEVSMCHAAIARRLAVTRLLAICHKLALERRLGELKAPPKKYGH